MRDEALAAELDIGLVEEQQRASGNSEASQVISSMVNEMPLGLPAGDKQRAGQRRDGRGDRLAIERQTRSRHHAHDRAADGLDGIGVHAERWFQDHGLGQATGCRLQAVQAVIQQV